MKHTFRVKAKLYGKDVVLNEGWFDSDADVVEIYIEPPKESDLFKELKFENMKWEQKRIAKLQELLDYIKSINQLTPTDKKG